MSDFRVEDRGEHTLYRWQVRHVPSGRLVIGPDDSHPQGYAPTYPTRKDAEAAMRWAEASLWTVENNGRRVNW